MTFSLSESENLFKESKRWSPGGVHSPVRAFKGVGGTPPFIQKSQGSKIFDVDGNEYIDFCMSWGPLILGHRNQAVEESIIEAIHKGWSYGTAEPYSLKLAHFLTKKLPFIEQIRFVNSGTEAVMSALRLARAFTQKDKIIKFIGCYHGHVDSMLVQAGSGLAEMAVPDSAGISKATASQTIALPLNSEEAVEQAFQRYGNEIAAVIIEPLPANNGLLPQRKEFLEYLRKVTLKNKALLIFDEVISGFRVEFGGMTEKLGITPDLVTYGKIIGGGFPVGAYGGRADLLKMIAPEGPVYQAGTLSANPVAMQAGLVTLQELDRLNPYNELEQKTKNIAKSIQNLNIKNNIKTYTETQGSLFWTAFSTHPLTGPIRSVDQIPKEQADLFKKIYHSILSQGIYLAPSAYEVGFLSTAHSQQDIDALTNSFTSAFI
ncbi:MAG: aspartate aminotransferase family protein [Bdellovibrionaceae bacterium]|nr:aspartate aminotransferase family protein [Pseudobdellovibrionaceae bacterium]|tara:strand:- start:2839 stop:4134 length:1296 start_codon:yes stop_codon:yes gene_type:complete